MRPWFGIAGLLVALGLGACGSPPPSDAEARIEVEGGGSYVDLSADRLAATLQAKDFTLINVHVPYAGEITTTDLFIPYDQIADRLAELPAPDSKIVLYCRSGSMSTTAAQTLVAAGYTQVWNLAGGMNAWRAAGYSLEESGQPS